ncbi:MAG: hypothetical protein Q8K60_06025, partial [Parachlamydiaceae bacterium]|nr:hypothetical protein [Parachlamydiaceae bacterium]
EILMRIKKQIFMFVSLDHSIEKTHPDYLQLKENIDQFCIWIGSQTSIAETYLNSILIFLINNPSIESSLLSETIFKQLLLNKSVNEIRPFKNIFFQSLTTILELKEFKIIENYTQLLSLFNNNKFNLNDHENEIQARFYYFIFEHIVDQKKVSKELDHQDAIEIANLYVTYLPFLKNKKDIYEKSINKITTIAQIYHFKYTLEKEKAQKKFHQLNFNQFFGVLYSIDENLNLNSHFLINFKGTLINSIKETCPKQIQNFIIFYGNFLSLQASMDPSKVDDAIDFLFLNVFLYPPFFESSDNNIQNEKQNDPSQVDHKRLSKYWDQYREMILSTEISNIFKDAPKKLLIIKFWCNINIQNKLSHILVFSECELIIKRLCSFPLSNGCLKIALNMLVEMISPTHPLQIYGLLGSLENVRPIYTVIVKAICQNGFYNEKIKIELFFHLINDTIINYNEKNKHIFCKIIYPYLKQLIVEIPDPFKDIYLTFCINTYFLVIKELLKDEMIWENFNNNVKFILPYVRNHLLQSLHNSDTFFSPMNSFNKMMENLSMTLMIKNKKNANQIFKNKKDLLFNWLELLCINHPSEHEDRKCRSLIHLFLYLSCYTENCFVWLDATSLKNKKIKNDIYEMIERIGTPIEKVILKTLLGLFEFKQEDRTKNINYLKKIFESLKEFPHSTDSFKMMQVICVVLFNWNEHDFINRTLNLIEDQPIAHQEVFEIYLEQVKSLIEKYSDWNTPFFLIALVNQCFESQWLRPQRPQCFDFMMWAKDKMKEKLKNMLYDPTFSLACYVFEHQKIFNNPEMQNLFWLNFSKEFNEFALTVINTKKLSQSWIIVNLICSSPTPIDFKHFLLKEWLSKLNTDKTNPSTRRLIKHKNELIKYFNLQTKTEFEIKEVPIPSNLKESIHLINFNPGRLLEEFSLDSKSFNQEFDLINSEFFDE